MYMDYNNIEQYPFEGSFYRMTIDESLPLDEQVEEKDVYFTTMCDITEGGREKKSNFVSATFSIFFPFNKETDKILVKRGDMFEGSMYGMDVSGKVIGVFPTQLGGCVVYITDLDV